ncbi:MAG: DUF4331 domain-containing protein [Methylibium sp.]|uniref:DUF4331 domain-containing protein n=1 Tax=Methylibium sp. TaxID=2067992 RepID=UPI00184C3BAF|nr:DUF4331 domain-containing protein [Methylibium sp.]MBA3596647.1 DUF4331 domain-containing protein [Methylibium sp.]
MPSHVNARRSGRLALTATALALAAIGTSALASSHREAPFLAMSGRAVDGTDLYMFRSYEGGRQDYVTVIANYIPFHDPQGGPNFYQFDPDAVYEIHFDNNGDAKEDLTFQFRFDSTSKSTALSVGGKQIKIPVINSGPIDSVNPDTLNVRETYSIDVVRGDRRSGERGQVTQAGGGEVFDKPVDNIGTKSFPGGYEAYADLHMYDVAIPGCGNGRVFVGQRQEPFYIAVGKIFDLINLDPLGPEVGGNPNDLEFKNISSVVMELPIACVASAGDPVVGAYTTSSLRQGRLLNPSPPSRIGAAAIYAGPLAQVSRLGMPLVNEVIIGLEDKDRFNASKPMNDTAFLDYVTNPALPAFIESLFPVQAPTNFPRTDLVTAFLTGLEGVNQPQNVVASEMLRLNTSIPANLGTQNPLGVAGGDNAGFPNGRRPGDDVVDVSLRVAMGALCVLTGAEDTLNVGCTPADAPSGGLAFTDGVRRTAAEFPNAFPYLNTPIPGSFND